MRSIFIQAPTGPRPADRKGLDLPHPHSGRHAPRRARLLPLAVAAALAMALPFRPAAAQAPAAPGAAAQRFDIPAGPLAPALTRFADQAGLRLLAPGELLRDRSTHGVHASLAPEQALAQLLAGTGLVHRFTAPGLVTLAVAAAPPPQAPPPAAAPSEGGTLPDTTVTATRDRKERAYETPAAVSAITREDIDRTGARHASEILQATPGVLTVTNEQIPSVSVEVRGLKDFGRVTMSIDGMRQNYQRSGHQQRNGEMFFDPEFLAGIDIEKGPTASIGGLGATGGIANFQTIEAEDILLPDKTIGLRLRGNTGLGKWSNGSDPSGSAAFAIKANDDLDLLFATAARRAGEYKAGTHGTAFTLLGGAGPGFTLPVNFVNLTNQDQDSLLFKARWKPLPGHQIKFTALQTRLDYAETAMQNLDEAYRQFVLCRDVDAAATPELAANCARYGNTAYDPAKVYPKSSSSQAKSTSLGLDYSWKPAGNPWVDLTAKLYYVSTDNRTVSTGDADSIFTTRTDTVGLWAVNKSLVPLGKDWLLDWRYGAEAFQDRNRPSGDSTIYSASELEGINGNTPRGNRLLVGAFTQASFQYRDWLQLTPGLRHEYARLRGHTGFEARDYINPGNKLLRQYGNIDVDRRFDRWLPSLGLAVKPTDAVQLFANAARGWRPPAITETLITGFTPGHSPGFSPNYFPNYLLEPEKTSSVEIGANLRWDGLLARADKLRLKATAFRSRTDGYTFFTNNIALPGGGWGLLNNMFVASTDPVVFKGFELDGSYDAGGWFAGLGLTQLKREATFMHLPAPLDQTGYPQVPTNDASNGYTPAPPKYSGRLTGGLRLLERQLELSATLRCASKGSHPTLEGGTLQNAPGTQNSFCVWDAQGVYRPSDRLSVGLTLRNIRDRQYAQAAADAYVRSYAPGRTLTLFTELRF
jgi:heme acquisition protein HasR